MKKQAHKEARELTTLFHAVFKSMTDSIIIHDLDGKIIHINPAAQKLLGLQPEAIVGTAYHQLLARFKQSQSLHNSEPPAAYLLGSDILTHGCDMQFCAPTGREMQVNVTDAPAYNCRGQVIGYITFFRDITEQRQKEHRVLQAFQSLLTLVEALAAIPVDMEEASSAVRITVTGKALADITNQVLTSQYVAIYMLEPPDDRQYWLGISGLPPEQEQRLQAETYQAPLRDYIDEHTIARLHANQAVMLDLKLHPFVARRSTFGARYRLVVPVMLHGQLIGLFIIAKTDAEHADVDSAFTPEEIALARGVAKLTALVIERVRLLQGWAEARANELALQEANRHYDAFLSIASHELRTPLTTIKGNIQLTQRRLEALKRKKEESAVLREQWGCLQKPLEYAVQRADAQERMISELLDASRIQANRLTLRIKPCNLLEIVDQSVKDIYQTATERTILLYLPVEKSIPILADADRIGQVVNNYLTNALKYSAVDRPVELYLMQKGSLARLEVRDKGPGLSAEDQVRIWERFYRAPGIEIQYGSDNGLGLGLHLSRTIIERHHGQVGVSSARGKGSTFWFTLPVAGPGDPPIS